MGTNNALGDTVVDFILREVANADEAYVRRVAENAKRLFANVAAHIEWHSALICCAEDPVLMVEVLRPVIADPRGAVHPMYQRIAERELQRRAARNALASQGAVLN